MVPKFRVELDIKGITLTELRSPFSSTELYGCGVLWKRRVKSERRGDKLYLLLDFLFGGELGPYLGWFSLDHSVD